MFKARFALLFLALAAAFPLSLAAQESDSGDTVHLDTLVVTASRVAESVREVTTNITVISQKEIENSSADTLDMLLAQKGFKVTKGPGNLSTVSVRGFATETHGNDLGGHVLILLDGRRLGTGNTAMIDLSNTERIEIIRGPAAVQYGAAAMGGIVNVITRKGTGQPFSASLEAGGGSYGYGKTQLKMSGSAGRVDFAGGFRYERSGDYDIGGGSIYKNSGYENYALNANLGYSLNDYHRLALSLNYFDSPDSGMPGYFSPAGVQDRPTTDKSNYTVGFDYSGSTEDERFSWLARYNFGQDKRFYDYPADDPFDTDSRYRVKSQTGQAQASYQGDIFGLTGGLDYLHYRLDNGGGALAASRGEYENVALFALAKAKLFDEQLILTAGGRYDHFDLTAGDLGRKSDKDHFSPSVGLAYLPTDWLKFRAHYSQAYAMPTLDQMTANFTAFGFWKYRGNPDLEPETSDTYELGFDITGGNVDFGLTYFWTKTKDFISTDFGTSLPGGITEYRYINKDKAYRSGLELTASADFGAIWGYDFELRPSFSLTHMFKYTTRDYPDSAYQHIRYIPETVISYGLLFHHPDCGLTVDLNFKRNGNEYAAEDIEHKSYTVGNLLLQKKISDFNDKGKLDLKLTVDNIFDEKYATDYSYSSFSGTFSEYYMPGRSFYLGLVYSY